MQDNCAILRGSAHRSPRTLLTTKDITASNKEQSSLSLLKSESLQEGQQVIVGTISTRLDSKRVNRQKTAHWTSFDRQRPNQFSCISDQELPRRNSTTEL